MDSATRTIAVLGGSSAFTPALARALGERAVDLPALHIRLCGRQAARLEAVSAMCNRVAARLGVRHRYSGMRDLALALDGADVVLNQIRVGGFEARAHDDTFSLPFGIPGDETIGPGGLASAIRSVPVIVRIARDVARVAPSAWFVNLTNPLGILTAALACVDGLHAFGLCELPADTLRRALALVGASAVAIEVDYVGVNHQGWFTRIEAEGRSILEDVVEAIAANPREQFFRIDSSVMRRLHALPLHYLRLYYQTSRELLAQRKRTESRGAELERLSNELYSAYGRAADGVLPPALSRREMPWLELAVIPAIVALLGGTPAELYVSERNGDYLSEIDPSAVLEKRCMLEAEGPRPFAIRGPIPESVLELLRRIVAFERAALVAAVDPTLSSVIAALRENPLVQDTPEIAALAERVLES